MKIKLKLWMMKQTRSIVRRNYFYEEKEIVVLVRSLDFQWELVGGGCCNDKNLKFLYFVRESAYCNLIIVQKLSKLQICRK